MERKLPSRMVFCEETSDDEESRALSRFRVRCCAAASTPKSRAARTSETEVDTRFTTSRARARWAGSGIYCSARRSNSWVSYSETGMVRPIRFSKIMRLTSASTA